MQFRHCRRRSCRSIRQSRRFPGIRSDRRRIPEYYSENDPATPTGCFPATTPLVLARCKAWHNFGHLHTLANLKPLDGGGEGRDPAVRRIGALGLPTLLVQEGGYGVEKLTTWRRSWAASCRRAK
jgi:hypothetical protein